MADDEELVTGTYVVMNAAYYKALQIRGGSGSNKNNFVIYPRDTDPNSAQFCSVVVDDGVAVLYYTLLGPVRGTVPMVTQFYTQSDEDAHDYQKKGTPKVDQAVVGGTYVGGTASQWRVERVAGEYVRYNAVQYPTYKLLNNAGQDGENAVVMAATSSADYGAVKLRWNDTAVGDEYKHWFFYPVEEAPSGYYTIRCASQMDRMIIEDTNNSIVTSSTTNRNDNRAIWALTNTDAQGRCYFVNLQTNRAMWLPSENRRIGGKPVCGALTTGRESFWVPVLAGVSDKLNSVQYKSYVINTPYYITDQGDAAILDPYYDQSTPRTLPDLRRITGNAKQRWAFTPAEAYDKNLKVPSDLALDYKDAKHYDLITVEGTAFDLFPSWVGEGDAWQLRYRIKTVGMCTGTTIDPVTEQASKQYATMSPDDTSWKSIFDNDPYNDGWGDIGTYNCDATLQFNQPNATGRGISGRYRSDMPIHVEEISVGGIMRSFGNDSGNVNYVEVEFEVRQWTASFGNVESLTAHGGSASHINYLGFSPSVNITSFIVKPNGIEMAYELNGVMNPTAKDFNVQSKDGYFRNNSQTRYNNQPVSWRSIYISPEGVEYSEEYIDDCLSSGLTLPGFPQEWTKTRIRDRLPMVWPNTGTYVCDFGTKLPKDGETIYLNWSIEDTRGFKQSGVSAVTVESELDTADTYEFLPATIVERNDGSHLMTFDNFITSMKMDGLNASDPRVQLVINRRPSTIAVAGEFDQTDINNYKWLDTYDLDQYGMSYMVPYPFGKCFAVRMYVVVTADIRSYLRTHYDINPSTNVVIFEQLFDARIGFRYRTRVWNWGVDDDWFEIFVNLDENPTETVTTKLTSANTKTTERAWETVQFGNTPEQQRTITGALYPPLMGDYLAKTEKFSKCKYAWYRSFDGEVLRVAIESVKEERKTWGATVDVDMRRVDG